MGRKKLKYYLSLFYPVIIYRENHLFVAEFPDLDGCIAYTEDEEKIYSLAMETKEDWIEIAYKIWKEIPEPLSFDNVVNEKEALDYFKKKK